MTAGPQKDHRPALGIWDPHDPHDPHRYRVSSQAVGHPEVCGIMVTLCDLGEKIH